MEVIEYENNFDHFYLIFIVFCRDNWKEVLKQRFIELKEQIEGIRLIYNNGSKCETPEDNKSTVSESYEDDESSDSDKDIHIIPSKSESAIDVCVSVRQKIENLEESFFHDDQNKIINEKLFYLFGHLLIRTFNKMKIYLNDDDIHTPYYSEIIKNIRNNLIRRQKQFQRLFRSNTLAYYDNSMLEFEITLQHRMNELTLSQTREPSFAELKANCLPIFDSYIRQCVNFHSRLKVNGIWGDFDEFIEYFSGEKLNIDTNERELVELAFTHFDIPLVNPHIVCCKKLQYRQNKSDNFIPSQHIDESIKREEEIEVNFIDLIKSIRNDRWTVLLGSAGTGKTTFARWLLCQFARALFIEDKKIIVENIDTGPVRIPILIRIGEFSEWLEDHPTASLFDYIGHQTWFSQNYANGELEVLKDFVRYGHALIILDGLDEVATVELHDRVVVLVRAFIQSHCRSHELISAFDDALMAKEEVEYNFRCEGLFGGNVILITSRILHYTIHPLNSELIIHYTIQPMSREYLRSFIENWCLHVGDEIIHLFNQYIPDFKEKKIKHRSNLKAKNLIEQIERNEKLRSLVSNPSVLSIVCTLFAQHGVDTFGTTRIQLYEKIVELMLRRWQYHQLNMPKDALISIFSNMAFYTHSRLGSSLIDEFDLTNLSYLTLKQWYEKNSNGMSCDPQKLRQQTKQFMQLLSEDAGIVAARALGVFGFLHLTFQEYFVCYAILNVNNSNDKKDTKELVIKFLSLFPNPRLRESLNLVLGWISSHWLKGDYEDFCDRLISKTNFVNKHMPLGSLWFVHALNDLAYLPSIPIVDDVLNTLLDASIDKTNHTKIFEIELRTALDRLPVTLVNNWLVDLFLKKDLTISSKIIHIIYSGIGMNKILLNWITPILCDALWKQIGLFNEEIDIYLDRILILIGAINSDRLSICSGSLKEYLLSQSIPKGEIHSSILTAIVALYGGLERNYSKTKRQTLVTFHARRMHRDSPLSSLFIEYLKDTTTEQTMKLKYLTDQCQKILVTTTLTSTILQKVHSLVVLFCVYSIEQSFNYERYVGSEVWQQAIRYMKVVLLYLREFFAVSPISKFKNNLTEIFEHSINDNSKQNLDFAQSVSHAYCRLLRTETSCLFPDFYMTSYYNQYPFAIKMPKKIELPNVADWSDEQIIRLLPFICCVSPISCPNLHIEEIEAEDFKLLKEGRHPFQLLQNKPIALLLAYIPASVQSLYIQILTQNQISPTDPSCLTFLHILIEFLRIMFEMEKHSIRFWHLFTVLLPTIRENRMENFFLPFVDRRRLEGDCKQLANVCKDNCFHSSDISVRIGNDQEKDCAYESAVIEEQDRLKHAQTDLELYAAACCSANLSTNYKANDCPIIWEEKLNQLWHKVQSIVQPLWRLDAMITICCIVFSTKKDDERNNRLKDRYHSVITSLQELESKLPLLTVVALFIRCMIFSPEDFQATNVLFNNILERLKTVTIAEQQAICEALLSFPSLRINLIQHVCQFQHLENMVKLNQIFERTSITFSSYLSTKFFPIVDITGTRSTLLISMQLSELNAYVQFLNDSPMKELHNPSISNPATLSTSQPYLKILKQEPIEILNVGAASMISALLRSHFVGIENLEIIQIKQSLVEKTRIDEAAFFLVSEWLNYRCDKRLCSFAYQAALLLALSNMWSSTIIEICCQLLSNENDYFRATAARLINDKTWRSEKGSNNIIINYIDQWNKKECKWNWEIEPLLKSLDIQNIDEIEQILQLERNTLEKGMKNISKADGKIDDYYYEVSSFQLIKNLSSEVQVYIITKLKSLLTSLSNSMNMLFLCWLLEHIPTILLNGNEGFIDLLIGILSASYPTKLKMAATKKLYDYCDNKQVENFLWNIIMNDKQENPDELIAKCIWSLFIQGKKDRFMQKKLKKLDQLREHSSSPLIRQAATTAMYSQIIAEPEKYDIVDVYHSYMANAGINRGEYSRRDDGYDRVTTWITKHASLLLPQFINDMYGRLVSTSGSGHPYYEKVAKQICKEMPKEFRDVVRHSVIGEKAFRKRLYEMSKREDDYKQKKYLYIYACLQQVSSDYVLMFFNRVVSNPLDSSYFEQLRSVEDRQSVDLLTSTLQSSLSLRKRYAAAELLVRLTVIDQVSATEVQNLLNAAVDSVQSQELIDSSDSLIEYDQKLRYLLLRLMVNETESIHFGPINMTNETSYIPIPSAIFQSKN